jgi:DNA-binding NarL/FixJ family response regulator
VNDCVPSIRLLHDDAGLWPKAKSLVEEDIRLVSDDAEQVIGMVSWTCATKPEVAQLDRLRDDHSGPIVALLERLPTARGARAVSALLEGSVLADRMEQALLPTLRAVTAGQCVVPGSIRELLQRPPLSPRERQVLAMVVLDFSNAEIADKLVVTESNVKSHLTSAFSKLGVSSRNAAAELILDHESGLGPGILRISPEE